MPPRVQPSLRDVCKGESLPGSELPGCFQISLREKRSASCSRRRKKAEDVESRSIRLLTSSATISRGLESSWLLPSRPRLWRWDDRAVISLVGVQGPLAQRLEQRIAGSLLSGQLELGALVSGHRFVSD